MTSVDEIEWRRPKGPDGTECATSECVEVGADSRYVVIRASQRPAERTVFYRPEFAAFITAAKAGEYDDLAEG